MGPLAQLLYSRVCHVTVLSTSAQIKTDLSLLMTVVWMNVVNGCILVVAGTQLDVLLLSLVHSIELLPEGKQLPIVIDPDH